MSCPYIGKSTLSARIRLGAQASRLPFRYIGKSNARCTSTAHTSCNPARATPDQSAASTPNIPATTSLLPLDQVISLL